MKWLRKKHRQLSIKLEEAGPILLTFEFTNILKKGKRGKVTLNV